jgi:hypothetical protein
MRLLLWLLLAALAYRALKGLASRPAKPEGPLRGRRRNGPLDLSRSDVRDARFKDLPDAGARKNGEEE